MFKSLKHKNFRIFFITRGLSLIGSFVQSTTLLWLVYEMTNSAFYVAIAALADQGSSFILSPFAGVMADRLPRRKLIIYTQIVAMSVAFLLAITTFTGVINIWIIIFSRLMLGITDGIEMPVRHTFIYDLVDNKSYLSNAIALHSSAINTSKMIGPALAGFLIPFAGASICFLINGISFLAFILGLYWMKGLKAQKPVTGPVDFFGEIKEGIQYSYHYSPIKYTLFLVISCALFGFSYTVLLPVFATKILNSGTEGLGLMQTAGAIGALAGTFFLASKKTAIGIERDMLTAAICYGISIILFSFSDYFFLSLCFLVFAGGSQVMVFSSSKTLLQLISEETKRGRVSSLYICVFKGCVALGGLLMGWSADLYGVKYVLLITGIICIVTAIIIMPKLFAVKGQYQEELIQAEGV